VSVVIPPQEVLQVTLPHVIAFLNRLGAALTSTHGFEGVRASSWYRDVETNRRVGGAPDSQHLLGLALDITGEHLLLHRLLIELRGVGLFAFDEDTHVHVQLLPAGGARREGLFA